MDVGEKEGRTREEQGGREGMRITKERGEGGRGGGRRRRGGGGRNDGCGRVGGENKGGMEGER